MLSSSSRLRRASAGVSPAEVRRSSTPAPVAVPVPVSAPDAGSAGPDAGAVTAKARREPRTYEGYLALGDRLRERERFEQALDAYEKAVELQPDSAEALTGRGLVLMDLGNGTEAEAAFQQALRANGRYLDAVMVRVPAGRKGDPRELAATAVWLASDAAGYVTGQTIPVDGGLTIA